MSKMKTNIEIGSKEGGTGRFWNYQANSSNLIHKKEKPVGRCEKIKNNIFDLVTQGQTKLYTKLLKVFYYIYGIKFQKNGSDMQYCVINL